MIPALSHECADGEEQEDADQGQGRGAQIGGLMADDAPSHDCGCTTDQRGSRETKKAIDWLRHPSLKQGVNERGQGGAFGQHEDETER